MKTTHFDHNCQDGCIECAKYKAVKYQRQGSQGAKLLETADSASSSQKKSSNLQSIVTKNEISASLHRLEDDLSRWLHLAPPAALLDRCSEVRVIEDSLGEMKLLVKADCADKEWKRLCQADEIEGNLKVV